MAPLGKRPHALGLRCEARQLHGFPLSVYLDGARGEDSSALSDRLPGPGRQAFRRDSWVSLLGRVLSDSVEWVPVDISEAWKHQEKHDYFFGAHDVNRMQFTQG